MTRYIGFTGAIGAGKDLCAEILSGMAGAPIMAFADPVRWAASAMFNVPIENFLTQEGKAAMNLAWGLTHRDMLRLVGTEMGRQVIRPDMWVHNLKQRAKGSRFVIVPDVRFEDEAAFIRENGILAHIMRRNNPYAAAMSLHASDAGIEGEKEDYLIWNSGTRLDLRETLKEVLLPFFIHNN